MPLNLSTREVHLLCARWSNPNHLPERASMPAMRLREYYMSRLTETVGDWLAIGILAWQYPLRRHSAFAPVEWMVGTMREHDSYLDALADIGHQLNRFDDPSFPIVCSNVLDEFGPISLGGAYADASAMAVLKIAHQVALPSSGRSEAFHALYDALDLVQRLKPGKTAGPLTRSWNMIFGGQVKSSGNTPQETRMIIGLKHAFVRALFPAMHVGQDKISIRTILQDFSESTAKDGMPSVFAHDLAQCLEMLDSSASLAPQPPRAARPLQAGMPMTWASALRSRDSQPEPSCMP